MFLSLAGKFLAQEEALHFQYIVDFTCVAQKKCTITPHVLYAILPILFPSKPKQGQKGECFLTVNYRGNSANS